MSSSFEVPINEYDGKITYGVKKTVGPTIADCHMELLSSSVEQLASLEQRAQSNFIIGRLATTSGSVALQRAFMLASVVGMTPFDSSMIV